LESRAPLEAQMCSQVCVSAAESDHLLWPLLESVHTHPLFYLHGWCGGSQPQVRLQLPLCRKQRQSFALALPWHQSRSGLGDG
jgi:hypothetical protein